MTTYTFVLVGLVFIFGAICLMMGLVIGANSRMRHERTEIDNDQPLVRTRVYRNNDHMEI